MMMIIVWLLVVSLVFGVNQSTADNTALGPMDIDELTEQSTIDQKWMNYMVAAPMSINLLGQVMVVASTKDVSFEYYSPNHTYRYIKYPKSFRATLLQISNEGYRAFLNAHSSMNKIRLYIRRIPQHMETVIKALSHDISAKLANRIVTLSRDNIERIGKTCVTLAMSVNNSFTSVMYLLDEVIEITAATDSLAEEERRRNEVEMNVTRHLHIGMQELEELHRERYATVRQQAQEAQEVFSKALQDIPTGFRAVFYDACRALMAPLKIFSSGSKSKTKTTKKSAAQPASNEVLITIVSSFSQSFDKFINKLPSNENETIDTDELRGFKDVVTTFSSTIANSTNNELKTQADGLFQQVIALIDHAMINETINITAEFKALANSFKPFMIAQKTSDANDESIEETSSPDDSSQNERLKVQAAQARLNDIEKRLDQYAAEHASTMERVHQLSANLSRLNLNDIHLKEILKMLREAFALLGELREQWSKLVLFFSDFTDQITTSFAESIKYFVETAQMDDDNDTKKAEANRNFTLSLLKTYSIRLGHESFLLYTLSLTYYNVSSTYLMPRLSGLQRMLAAKNASERDTLQQEIRNDTIAVQAEIENIFKERQEKYQRIIKEKRATLNDRMEQLGADEVDQSIIDAGEKIRDNENNNKEPVDPPQEDPTVPGEVVPNYEY